MTSPSSSGTIIETPPLSLAQKHFIPIYDLQSTFASLRDNLLLRPKTTRGFYIFFKRSLNLVKICFLSFFFFATFIFSYIYFN